MEQSTAVSGNAGAPTAISQRDATWVGARLTFVAGRIDPPQRRHDAGRMGRAIRLPTRRSGVRGRYDL